MNQSSHQIITKSQNLDFLRIFSCAGVLSFHYWGVFTGLGEACVMIFFALSGYLASKTQLISVSEFYFKKSVKLLPTLIICVILSIILNLEHFVDSMMSHRWYFYFLHPGHLKSLLETYNVSVWFMFHYIAISACIPLFIRMPNYLILSMYIVLCIAMILFHSSVTYVPFSRSPIYLTLLVFISGYIQGVASIRTPNSLLGIKVKKIFLLFVTVLSIAISIYLLGKTTPFRGLFIIFCSLCTSFVIKLLDITTTKNNIVRILSGMTYSIFLLHCPIIYSEYSKYILIKNYPFLTSITITICLSYYIYTKIELPLTKIKYR